MGIKIPYGRGFLRIDDINGSYEILNSRIGSLETELSGAELVLKAMQNPIGSPKLRELARGKKSAVVIISDHTRPVPSKEILPAMLSELRENNPDIDITLLVATGCHRLTKTAELREKLGDEIFENEKIIVHDCQSDDNIAIGVMPSGAQLVVNKIAIETELLVAEGFIEPHFFAGFSGGRKSVLPGICDQKTVMGNHCSKFLADERAVSGVLEGNPINLDMITAARMANFKYIVNVILGEGHRTVAAFAGDVIEAHQEGCDLLMKYCGVHPERPGDIVITSNGGAPLDQNIYQAVKAIVTADGVASENGVIIMCAECIDGSGSDHFYAALRDSESAQALLDYVLTVPQEETTLDQWQYQMLVRVLVKHHVIMVTRPELEAMVRDMKMDFAPTIDEAIRIAREEMGENAHTVIVPDGISVVPEVLA